MLKIRIPQIQMHRVARRGFLAPQLLCSESNGIKVLRLLAQKMRVGVWKHEDAVMADNRSLVASYVAREPGVALGVDIARAHTLAHLKPRRGGCIWPLKAA